VRAVKELLDSGESFLLLDCREPQEYEIAKIEQARLIPMREIPNREAEYADYRDKRIVVHCHVGGRSFHVMQWLRENGFPCAQNMSGGISAWSHEIDPSVPTY
jgi:rhodanese-related sulfurtransferase